MPSGAAAGRDGRRPGPGTGPRAEPAELAPDGRHVGRCRQLHRLRDHRQDPRVGHGERVAEHLAEGTRTALPVQEGAGLLRHDRDRQHDVGERGDRRVVVLEGDDEAGRLDRPRSASRGIRVVLESDAADDEGREVATAGGVEEVGSAQARRGRAGRQDRCPTPRRPRRARRDRSADGHRAAGRPARRRRAHRARPHDAAPTRARHRSRLASAHGRRGAADAAGDALADHDHGAGLREERTGLVVEGAPGPRPPRPGEPARAGRRPWRVPCWRPRRPTPRGCRSGPPCAGAGTRWATRPRARRRPAGRSARTRGRRRTRSRARRPRRRRGRPPPRRSTAATGSRCCRCRAPRGRTARTRRRPRRCCGRRPGRRRCRGPPRAHGRRRRSPRATRRRAARRSRGSSATRCGPASGS